MPVFVLTPLWWSSGRGSSTQEGSTTAEARCDVVRGGSLTTSQVVVPGADSSAGAGVDHAHEDDAQHLTKNVLMAPSNLRAFKSIQGASIQGASIQTQPSRLHGECQHGMYLYR